MMLQTRRQWLASSLVTALSCKTLGAAEPAQAPWRDELEKIRLKHDLPALGAAWVTINGMEAGAVVGVRKKGSDVPAGLNDLWHLGSNTKAMTSTLAALAVQEGKLRWNSTLAEIFPQQRDLKKHPLSQATLTHLLSHWSGLPANAMWGMAALGGKDVREQRAAVLRMAVALEDLPAPGTKHLYSNWGYALAGHMLEKVWNASWEESMQQKLFAPLGITRAGFGGTGTPGKLDQPWPHLANGEPTRKNGPEVDNPPPLGPAGTVHMPLEDWARFIAGHLQGAKGTAQLLKGPEVWRHLHRPTQAGESYAYGWHATERQWGGQVITHNGSNTMNHSVAWVAPEKGFAMLAVTNSGSKAGPKALDEAVGLVLRQQAKV